MDELAKNDIIIENMIYEIRGKQVMLDSDLAMLYKVETKVFNQAVKRNIKRFPKEFCFQINIDELEILRSQFVTSSLEKGKYGGRRYLPYVFTEQGVAMLSAILKNDIAIETSIKIINAFVSMRKYLSNNLINNQLIANQVIQNSRKIEKNEKEIRLLQTSFKKFEERKIVNEIYYNGQIYDAYSIILDIFNDRYFILDQKDIYHCGASVNHARSKTFSINLLEDEIVKQNLIKHINKISA